MNVAQRSGLVHAGCMKLSELRARLNQLSLEMSELIKKYHLSAESSLNVIENARETIHEPKDYLKFLELSLEGRILADEGERLMKMEQN